MDLGADDYNLPRYFGKQRWSYYRLRAEGHNTLVLNLAAGPDQDPRAATKIIRHAIQPERAFAIADLTPAYAREARSVKRGTAMLDRRCVLVQDEIKCDAGADLWWFAHTPAAIEIASGGKRATLSRDGRQLTVRLLAPVDAKFEKLAAGPLPASPHPPKQRENKGIQKLAIHLPGQKDTTVAVVFEPAGNETTPKVLPLETW